MEFPPAPRLDIVDTLHGREVRDPFRWLEDAGSDDTAAWVAAQSALTDEFLATRPARARLRARLKELLPGFVGPPHMAGGRAFFLRRQPDQDHAVFYVREPDGSERALIDPNALSEDHTITLDVTFPSHDGTRLAYELSEGGDEISSLHVMDVDTGEAIDGPIVLGRTGPVEWLPGGEELIYVRRLPDLPPEEEQFHRRVWRHRVGDPAEKDALLFGEGRDKTTYYDLSLSRDGRWLVVTCHLGTAPRNDVYICDLAADGDGTFVAVQEDVDAMAFPHVDRDGRMYVITNRDAPHWRLAVADPSRPTADAWSNLLPEEPEAVLQGYALTDDAVVAVRQRHVIAEVTVHDKATGEARRAVDLPGLGVADVTARPDGGDDVWIGYTDFVTPYRVLHHRVATGTTEVWADAPGAVATAGITARQVFYPSADGTRVPMFVIARDDVRLKGENPTILYGYGGFNNALAPAYSSGILTWVERGGVYAIANLRGGSEYGEEWHRAGMRERKQNVFDDFFAAAEWLIGEKWTSPERLGISGGSNGGLLVGAALTQRPELFRSVVCSAPLLDMVRYEQFGLGVTWNDEYGTADDPDELGWLLSYSPYHRVEEGVRYPAVLFTVFESDSRVDPLHARKMCAALQHATASDHPVLIRIETKVGHGTRSVTRMIDLAADTSAFMSDQLGLSIA